MTAIKHRCDTGGGGWTLDTLQEHWQVVQALNDKFLEERDRRYAEVRQAEEKAVVIKEQADQAALSLARDIQAYKDEKANELREQISSERGSYATKDDLAALAREINATLAARRLEQSESLKGTTGIFVVVIAAASLAISVIIPFVLHR